MATLKLDRKRPDAAIPLLVDAVNNLLPVGTRIKTVGKAPSIGEWSLISSSADSKEYERRK